MAKTTSTDSLGCEMFYVLYSTLFDTQKWIFDCGRQGGC